MTYPCCRHCTHPGHRLHLSRCPYCLEEKDMADPMTAHVVHMDGDPDAWRCLQCDWQGTFAEAAGHLEVGK